MMPDRSVAVRLLLCTWLAAALPPPNTNNQHPTHQERKFGGYRIVPKPCKDTTSTSEVGGKARAKSQGEGVCMFNYECAQREGTVIGSCMDGFLFGACCRLPPGVAITPHDITSPHSTTTISSPSISSQTVESIRYSVRPMTYKPTAETVLLHKNGSAVHDSNSPEEFEAFTKPLTRATSPRPEFSTFSYVSGTGEKLPDTRWTTRNPQKSTVWVSASDYSWNRNPTTEFTTDNFPQSTNEIHYESSSSSFNKPINDDEENMIRIPTFSVNSQDVEDATNAASINHILNILNDTVPVKPPSTTSHQSAGLSTWVSVNGRPEKTSTATYYSPSSKVSSTTVPSVKSPYSTTTTTSSTTHFYSPTSSSSIFNKSPTKPLYATSTTTNYFYYDKKKPERPGSSTTTQNIVGPSFQVTPQVKITPKPPAAGQQQQQEPAPTVIVLGPLNPVTTKRPPVTESTTTTVVSIKPQVTSTLITVKPQSTPDPHKPLYTQIILPRPDVVITTSTNGQKPTVDIYTTAKPKPKPTRPRPPVSEAGTYITAKPQLPVNQKPLFQRPDGSSTQQPITGSTELLVAFPPVRDPNVNLTAVQQDEISQTTVDDQDDSTPHFTVDENLDDKVHGFVEKIVQSLEGNFVDLENVLLDGQARPNITVSQAPIKRPAPTSTIRPLAQSTPTKRPTKRPNQRPTPTTPLGSRPTSSQRPTSARPTPTRPTSRPTTVAVITRPPPTSSTLSTPRPKPKPPSTTVLLFQPGSTSTTTTTNKPYNKRPTVSSTTILVDHIAVDQYSSSSTLSSSSYAASTQTTTNEPIKTSTELDYRRECGVRPLMKNGRIVGGKGATFGEWPWQVLVREATWLGLFTKNKCGGVLITNKYVITAAHCQPGFLASLVAVFGEYDISGEFESKRSVSRNVRRVIVHRQYDPATFENDIALLELETPVQFDSHIVPICMPQDDDDFTGRMATVTGWGRLKYGGGVPSVLQEVHVPVMENAVCQEMFQTAGHTKSILNSFLCAGYANGQRDSCEGDSGGPLMVEREDGHWVLAGTVSHGIKCAAPYLPGVYMRTTFYKPWLQSITGVRSF